MLVVRFEVQSLCVVEVPRGWALRASTVWVGVNGFYVGIAKMDVSVAVDARINIKTAHSNLIELFKCTTASISPRFRAGTNRSLFKVEIASNPATRVILISNVLP